jgi:putative oxidoreductase
MSLPAWRQLLGPWLAWAFRVGLGLVFIVASLDKIAHPEAFASSIANYHLVPLWGINPMAICLPWIELICGLLLVLGLQVRANLLVIWILLAIFIIAIGVALHSGYDISCGCFSTDPSAHAMTRWTLYWDIAWLAMATHALYFDRSHLSLARLWRRGHTSSSS